MGQKRWGRLREQARSAPIASAPPIDGQKQSMTKIASHKIALRHKIMWVALDHFSRITLIYTDVDVGAGFIPALTPHCVIFYLPACKFILCPEGNFMRSNFRHGQALPCSGVLRSRDSRELARKAAPAHQHHSSIKS